MSTHKHTNRLISETSPYLLQHAHNPVDWYPWAEEAFEKAKKENKPIFLSIGYSTCHWCHVMERESFENESVAEIMNKHFVNVKVDREENPGVDKLYMSYVTYTTGSGGWPLSLFLTPERYPFFGATYLAPEDQLGRPGLKTLLKRVAHIWTTAPEKVRASGESMITQLQAFVETRPSSGSAILDATSVAEKTYDYFAQSFDKKSGGFGGAPKFPTPVQLLFLMDYYYYNLAKKQDQAVHALEMTIVTLRYIAAGGIRDHVGNGFHRYSTDDHWHVPHFEKMLYDQAQLLTLYASAYKLTKDKSFLDVVKDIILYVKRDLRHGQLGAFYSAEDADSLPSAEATQKKEGAFCVWEAQEIDQLLEPRDIALYKEHYGIMEQGNVDPKQDPHNELQRKNVLYIKTPLAQLAASHGMEVDEVEKRIKACNTVLLKYRQTQRPKPHCDDKIITAWNGLMISGLSHAYSVLHDPNVLTLATQAADFIHQHMYNADTKILSRSYRDGKLSPIEGFGDDYSFLIEGLIQLYQVSSNDHYLQWASDLQETQNRLFHDQKNGGYFNVAEHDDTVLVRMKEEQDGAEPSINAVSVKNLTHLSILLSSKSTEYTNLAQTTIESFELGLSKFPFALPALVCSYLVFHHGVKELILVTSERDDPLLVNVIDRAYVANKLLITPMLNDHDWLCAQNEIVADIRRRHEKEEDKASAVYICEHFSCGLPICDEMELQKRMLFQPNSVV